MAAVRLLFAFVALTLLLFSLPGPQCAAATFDFVVVASTDSQVPGQPDGVTFNNLPRPAMRSGKVVFRGEGTGFEGIYGFRDGELEVLADRNTAVPGDPANSDFVEFIESPSLDASYNVAFLGRGGSGVRGIYTITDGVVSEVADTNTNIPGIFPQVQFTGFGNPWIADGNVVFRGTGPGGVEGVYTNLGGNLRRVASTSTNIPQGTGTFTSFGRFLGGIPAQAPSIGGDTIAFYGAGSDGQQGIYAELDGSLIRIADTNTPIPGGGGATFPGFDVNGALSAATYDDGVVFVAGLDSNPFPNRLGIYKWWNEQLMTIADQTTQVSGSGGTLTSFGEAQGLSFLQDEYSFLGNGPGNPQGIYAILEGEVVKVLVNNEFLEGKPVGSMGSYGQGIDDGAIVFNVGSWGGGGTVNVVAIQEHRWLGSGSSAYGESGTGHDWEDKSNWNFGALPRGIVPTNIDPDAAATIHGPLADTELASLELGSGNGVATLWLFNGALITTPSTTIHAKGVLAGEGRISGTVTNNGVIRPDDISTGTIHNNGLIDLATSASRLSTGNKSIVNNGIIHVDGVLSTGPFPSSILNHATIEGDGMVTTSNLTNHGELRVATLSFTNQLVNHGLVEARRIDQTEDLANQPGGEIVLVGDNALIEINNELINRGLIRGSGRIRASFFENRSSGEIRVGAGERLIIDAPSEGSNESMIEVIEGELEFRHSVLNDNTSALIAARDATLRFGGGGLTNSGALAISFGTTDVFGDIENRPAGFVPAGSIVLTGNSNTTFYGDVINDGSVQVSTGSTAVFLGDFTGANGTTGGGTVFLEGDLRPGNSPAQISFGGDLHFGATAGLEIELGGLNPGSEYDQVFVAGDVFLGGVLEVSLIDDFALDIGQSFEIIDVAGTRSGTFNGLDEGSLVAELGGIELFITYAGGDGDDVVLFTGLPGDYNGDGVVNLADYTVWRDNLGGSDAAAFALGSRASGVTGPVSQADYDAWKNSFGQSVSSGAGAALNGLDRASVPEPGSVILLLLGGALSLVRLRHLRSIATDDCRVA